VRCCNGLARSPSRRGIGFFGNGKKYCQRKAWEKGNRGKERPGEKGQRLRRFTAEGGTVSSGLPRHILLEKSHKEKKKNSKGFILQEGSITTSLGGGGGDPCRQGG